MIYLACHLFGLSSVAHPGDQRVDLVDVVREAVKDPAGRRRVEEAHLLGDGAHTLGTQRCAHFKAKRCTGGLAGAFK